MNLPPESQPEAPAEGLAATPEAETAKPARRRRTAVAADAAEAPAGAEAATAAEPAEAAAPKPRRRRKEVTEAVEGVEAAPHAGVQALRHSLAPARAPGRRRSRHDGAVRAPEEDP